MMFTLDNLRKINSKLVKVLHRGMQCSSCGLRYPPEGTQQYSHHLDWHFRMNKKQQDSTKKVNTRKFYFTMDDWVQFEEIEDIEERVPSMFEVEGQMNSKSSPNENDDEEEEIPSVAVSSDPSLGVDGINYHPGCHEDHLKAIKQEEERQRKAEEEALRAKLEEEERLKKEAEEEAKKAEEEAKKAEEEAKKAEEEAKKAEEEAKKAEEDAKIAEEEAKIAEEEAKKADEETLMDVDEDIQEIEKVKDEKPKLEIDLTSEEPKLVTEEVKSDEPTDKVKKTSLEKVKDALRNISAISNGLSPFRIKEEPMEGEGEMKIYTPYLQPRILADIPIKMEIEEEEDNLPLSFDVEDDDEDLQEIRVNQNDSWMAPAPITTAETDIASSIDGNTELTTSAEVSVPKIKISVSLPTKMHHRRTFKWGSFFPIIFLIKFIYISLILKILFVNIWFSDGFHFLAVNNGNNNYSSSSEDTSSDDADSWHHPPVDDFIPPPFTVDLTRKPAFRGVQLKNQPIAQRGVEISSLCSIM
ncbi:hypothetical protein Anas_00083 [Armadillidium nasatum]|uniref:Pcf11 Clp1-ID domain-containing protein n=1 Tax=Armadillidium nasatum TaxID=96803 RepID=A0A5N5SZB8_9CRUS|nr:hypothetical protein Anas_00083 [Armadillidium nasatum]